MAAYVVPNAMVRVGLRKMIRCMRRERDDPVLRALLPATTVRFRQQWPLRAPDGAR